MNFAKLCLVGGFVVLGCTYAREPMLPTVKKRVQWAVAHPSDAAIIGTKVCCEAACVACATPALWHKVAHLCTRLRHEGIRFERHSIRDRFTRVLVIAGLGIVVYKSIRGLVNDFDRLTN